MAGYTYKDFPSSAGLGEFRRALTDEMMRQSERRHRAEQEQAGEKRYGEQFEYQKGQDAWRRGIEEERLRIAKAASEKTKGEQEQESKNRLALTLQQTIYADKAVEASLSELSNPSLSPLKGKTRAAGEDIIRKMVRIHVAGGTFYGQFPQESEAAMFNYMMSWGGVQKILGAEEEKVAKTTAESKKTGAEEALRYGTAGVHPPTEPIPGQAIVGEVGPEYQARLRAMTPEQRAKEIADQIYQPKGEMEKAYRGTESMFAEQVTRARRGESPAALPGAPGIPAGYGQAAKDIMSKAKSAGGDLKKVLEPRDYETLKIMLADQYPGRDVEVMIRDGVRASSPGIVEAIARALFEVDRVTR